MWFSAPGRRFSTLAAFAAAWAGIAGAAAAELTVAGEVARGERFEAGLCPGAAFALVPDESGWTIWIGDPAHADENWAAVRTPPYRGVNALHIAGWHFRNASNSGPNRAGAGNVNAPGRERAFRFVTSRADYATAAAALDVLMWPGNWSGARIEAARAAAQAIADGEGRLEVETLALSPPERGARAYFERMTFAATLDGLCD